MVTSLRTDRILTTAFVRRVEETGRSGTTKSSAAQAHSAFRLTLLIIGNSLQRIASGASGVLIGLYLAHFANHGATIGVALVGTLSAVSFGAEFIGAVPLGVASDAISPRMLVTAGSLLGAGATLLFGMSGLVSIFFLSRALEGLGAAAVTPPLLAHLTDVTDLQPRLRAKMMSYFELSLLAGLALGGVLGSQLWRLLAAKAFGAVAVVYVLAAGLLFVGALSSHRHGRNQAAAGFFRALREPSLQRLAPVWLCMNTIVGLWLGPTLIFLLTHNSGTHQFLAGVFVKQPTPVGWVLLGYSIIFGIGVTAWSFVLPYFSMPRALWITLLAMLFVSGEFFLLNHSRSSAMHWIVGAVIGVSIIVESGFTPAALALLAGAIGAQAGRGAAMGIYSALFGVGAIAGSLLAAAMGQAFAVDGLIYSTFAMAVLGLFLIRWIKPGASGSERSAHGSASV